MLFIYFRRGLTCQEAIELLLGGDGDEMPSSVDLYIAPPDPAILTDEDSAEEDEGGLIDNLSGRQLLADAEIKFSDNTVISTLPDENVNNLSEPRPSTSQAAQELQGEMRDLREPVVGLHVSKPIGKCEIVKELLLEKQKQTMGKKKNKPIHKTWIKGDIEPSTKHFPLADFSSYRDFSAAELFELFFDEDLYDIFVEQSERYAMFKNCPNPNISKDEIKCFIGILVLTSYHTLPGKRFYWDSQPDMGLDIVTNAMRRNRFQQIMRFLHCVDNNVFDMTDKMWKLRPMIDKIKENCLKHFQPEQNLSFDESMVEYFGRHGCKQHIRGKPIRFGFKIWSLCTVSGYLVAFDVYQGKSLSMPSEYDELFGKSSAPLVKLLDDLPCEKQNYPYRIFFDNLFTNFYLLKYFQEIGYSGVGTLREDRIPRSCPLPKKQIMKTTPRGYFESALCKEDGILVCKWHDNGIVSVASNCHGIEPIASVKRYSQSEKKHVLVQRPAAFTEYNKNMGGVDKMDENINRYRVAIRSKKWYWPILTWLIDVCVNNAWQIRRNGGHPQAQLDFRRELVNYYITKYGVARKGAGRPISSKRSISDNRVSDDIRYDRMDHLVTSVPENKKRRCAGEGCSSIIRTMCKKCQVGLCVSCFSVFHSVTY